MASWQAEQRNFNTTRGEERASPSPPHASRNPRFSYMETPSQMSRPQFEQFSSPPNSAIDESPVSPIMIQNPLYDSDHPAYRTSSYPDEKEGPSRTASPYNFPPLDQTHPAHFAPYAEETIRSPSNPISPSHQYTSLSPRPYSPGPEEIKRPIEPMSPGAMPVRGPDIDPMMEMSKLDVKRAPTYNPNSLVGPNVAIENHHPGQISHPNATIDPEWKHGLCELDTTCCVGLFCPCILYGKTQYRLSQKAKKQQATDLLGYEACNGSCTLMAVACGFQWVFTVIQRTRVRKLYNLNSSIKSDCLKSFCCCCCVLMQDEREVRSREELLRQHAGPASGAYTIHETMTYQPPPR